MALVFADRVKETSATTGVGSMSLAGAMTGFQAFSDTMADGDNCYYTITDGVDWEVGYGTYETTGNLLLRSVIIASSNSDLVVNWTSATEIFMTHPAVITLNTVLNENFVTDNTLARFDGTSGLAIQGSSIVVDDTNNMSGIGNIALSGTVDGRDVATDGARLDTITDANYLNSNTTKSQVGLGNADNTSDATKLSATLAAIYPVGSVYISTNSSLPTDISSLGTWATFGAGKVLVGRDSGDTDFDTAEETGGSKTVDLSHAHAASTMGAHFSQFTTGSRLYTDYETSTVSSYTENRRSYVNGSEEAVASHSESGSAAIKVTGDTDSQLSATQSVVQPYIVVYMWKRTA